MVVLPCLLFLTKETNITLILIILSYSQVEVQNAKKFTERNFQYVIYPIWNLSILIILDSREKRHNSPFLFSIEFYIDNKKIYWRVTPICYVITLRKCRRYWLEGVKNCVISACWAPFRNIWNLRKCGFQNL